MGNKTDKPEDNKLIMSSVNMKHPKFAMAKYIQPKDELPYLQISQAVQNKSIYEKWKKGITKYAIENSNQIQTILLPKELQFEQKGLCGSSGVIKSRYPVLPFILSEEISNRASIKQPFMEKQLWYLLYILNIAGGTAHSRGIILGDMRPQNVMMSEDGQICVCCLQTFIQEQKNYYKTLSLKIKTYLAPEQVKDLQQGKDACTESQCTSECFSIGLTALAALLLRDESNLYGIDYTFNEQLFNKELNDLRNSQKYSKFLRQVIQGMLAVNPNNRLKCEEVVSMLKPYQQQIVNLDQFDISEQQIAGPVKQKLSMAVGRSSMKRDRSTQYLKVINNNDFNRNSRVQYTSPRTSSFLQSQTFAPPPQVVIAQSRAYQNGQPVIQNQPVMYKTEMVGMQNVPIPVYESVYTPAHQPTNLPFIVNRPDIMGRPMPHPIQSVVMASNQNNGYYNPNMQIPQQIIVPTNINSKTSNSFVAYNSGFQSFIPDQYQYAINQNRVNEARPAPNQNGQTIPTAQYNQYNSQQGTSNRDSTLYDSYEKAMKNIDERMRQSRREFPDNL